MPNFLIQTYQFFNHPFFIVIGGLFALMTTVGFLITFIFWALGITPLLWRLGLGRWMRKIAIAANTEAYNSLKTDLIGSGIFREKNIEQITAEHLSKIKNHSVVVVHYQSFTEQEIHELLNDKQSTCGMIFYFPRSNTTEEEKIPQQMMLAIGKKENTVVVNFRGRLLNDIIITLITTSYEKR